MPRRKRKKRKAPRQRSVARRVRYKGRKVANGRTHVHVSAHYRSYPKK